MYFATKGSKMTKIVPSITIGKIATTPLGPIWVAVSGRGLAAVAYLDNAEEMAQYVTELGFSGISEKAENTSEARRQISEYLAGGRKQFDLAVDWSAMAPFQRQALQIVFSIPYGSVMTYGEIAHHLGKPGAARAVGRANATNPMPLVIPCHRVIGSDGKLHGYGGRGGLSTKAWLLQMEKGGTASPAHTH
jgi:methylated-DNA-[protein]-cysteine S-methyltransferase